MISMKTMFGSAFGKVDGSIGVALTIKGLGVKIADGSYAIYDKDTNSISTVPSDMILGEFPSYAFPTNELVAGDLIVHGNTLKFVKDKNEDGSFSAVNVKTQTIETILPAKTMLGYIVASKVFSPFSGMGGMFGGSSDGKPAMDSNMLMMMAMLGDGDLFGGKGGKGGDMDSLLPLMMMGGMGGAKADGAGPFGNMQSMLPMLMMMKAL